MKKSTLLILFSAMLGGVYAQNIGINTTGASANALNMLEILQISTTANSVGLYTSSSGNIAGTGYGFKSLVTGTSTTNVAGYFSATNATNNYAGIFENGYVGIGTASPISLLTVGTGTNTYPSTPAGTAALTMNSTSLARIVMNDGTGNFQQYLNSYYDATAAVHKYVLAAQANRLTISSGTFGFYVAPTGAAAGNTITWTTGEYIDNSGNVGFGTTAPTLNTANGTVIQVNNANASYAAIAHFTNGTTGAAAANGLITGMWTDNNAYVFNYYNSALIFGTNATERMRISAGGDVGIGVSPSGTYKLEVNGHLKTTAINETSDIRLKKNIFTIDNALAKLEQLRGVTYEWRADEYKDKGLDTTQQIGLIAQEVEKIFPQLVGTDAAGFKSVEYSKMVAILIEAIKDQQKIIDSQKAEINSLNANVNTMSKDIASLKNSFEILVKQGNSIANK